MTRKTATEHWWLQDEQSCDFCMSGYALHVEIRCVDCDRPICPLCVVHVRETVERGELRVESQKTSGNSHSQLSTLNTQLAMLCPECDAERSET